MTLVAISDIQVDSTRRPLRDIKPLAASIAEIGLQQPIGITADKRLVYGGHRLAACRSLGMKEIEARVVAFSEGSVARLVASSGRKPGDVTALLIEQCEIDENLCHAALSVLERGEQLARRKEIYEALHPDAKPRSSERQRARAKGEPTEIISAGFADEAGAKARVTSRTVRQEVQIATAIPADVRDRIRALPMADHKNELLALARQEPAIQRAAVARVEDGSAKTVRASLALDPTLRARHVAATKAIASLTGVQSREALERVWRRIERMDEAGHLPRNLRVMADATRTSQLATFDIWEGKPVTTTPVAIPNDATLVEGDAIDDEPVDGRDGLDGSGASPSEHPDRSGEDPKGSKPSRPSTPPSRTDLPVPMALAAGDDPVAAGVNDLQRRGYTHAQMVAYFREVVRRLPQSVYDDVYAVVAAMRSAA